MTRKRKRKGRIDYALFAQRFENARLAAGLTQAELAKTMEGVISAKTIPKYESGEIMPKAVPFILMCRGLEISPDYFFTPFRPEIQNIHFRKPLSLGARKNKAVELQVADTVERFLNIEETLGIGFDFHNPLEQMEISKLEDVERAVDVLREEWKLGVHALPNVIEILEGNEIRTVEVDADLTFDGLAGLADGRLPFIALNKNLDLEGKRLTVLRELGHGALQFPKDLSEKEKSRFCEAFARSMLIPKETFLKALGRPKRKQVSIQELIGIRETFGLGLQAIMVRALDLGMIRPTTHKKFKKFIDSLEEGTDLGAYMGKEAPNRVKQLVYRATSEETINQALATDILNVNYRGFQKDFTVF